MQINASKTSAMEIMEYTTTSSRCQVILKPLVTKTPSFLRDTKQLLTDISSLTAFPPHALLVTMDVVGLYSNIPHEDGANACQEFLDQRASCNPPTDDVVRLIELVLSLNCFVYNNQHYRQTLGTAMGTRMAPSYANLFMAKMDKKIRTAHSAPDGLTPAFYKRFIDDLIMVWLHGDACLLRFFDYVNSIHPQIRFTMEFRRSVHYMDSQLTIEENGQISSDLYIKPTDKHQYLLPTSNHPPHVHRHLPYGLAIRLRQIVSVDERFIMRLGELKSFLLARGYQSTDIDRQFAKAMRVPRSVALHCKKKISEDRVPLVCEWNERLPNLGSLIHQYLPILHSNEDLSICFKHPPLASYRRPRHLKDILVHKTPHATGRPGPPDLVAGTYKCEHARCLTCPVVCNRTAIKTCSGQRSITGHFTCESSALVYLITCSTCNAAYVGETGQKLRERLKGHRADIRNKADTPVGVHFGMSDHHLRVSGLEGTSSGTRSRRLRECAWIRFFQKSNVFTCMNRDNGLDILTL